jgi:hypothetical protein
MTELHTEISHRASRATQDLRAAKESGDDYLATVREAELEGLARIAHEHGLRVPELAGYPVA